ncbi:hypothetical protein J2S43_004054 [Catenuloplanes nepalensis]|uniref:Uncharacterized protein n=1 Tax=Catenuloplanes nepalensis TaxID=587533 RepID=A0ABT9MVS9_9ACTN|nr:hypothetical protein [Catenuloplanes nepalensis]MDP9795542.1 hypothetical protein [Catenuloplanes nepalensis]
MTSRTRAARRPAWSLRVGAALAGLAGGVVLAAPPAHAEPGQVDLRISDDLATDSQPRQATLRVTRTDEGCVSVQTLLTVQMTGLERDEIEVAVNEDGVWIPLDTVQLTDDAVSSVPVVPAIARVCENQRIEVRYRVTFFQNAPDGRVAFIAEAFSRDGDRLDRAAETRQVLQGTGNARANDEEEPADEEDTVEPTPDDEETAEAGAAQEDDTDAPAAGASDAGPGDQAAGVDLTTAEGQTTFFNGLGPLIIVVGVGMTGVGGALLVTVMRRSRADRLPDEDDDGFAPPVRRRGALSPTLRR